MAATLISAAWLLSGRYRVIWVETGEFAADIRSGFVVVWTEDWLSDSLDRDTRARSVGMSTSYWRMTWPLPLRWGIGPDTVRWWQISMWLPFLLTALPAGFLWHRHRRTLIAERVGVCPYCRYPRAGLAADAPCPECGEPS